MSGARESVETAALEVTSNKITDGVSVTRWSDEVVTSTRLRTVTELTGRRHVLCTLIQPYTHTHTQHHTAREDGIYSPVNLSSWFGIHGSVVNVFKY